MVSGIPRILIVDDEPGIRKLLSTCFRRAGYEVQVASNGPEAIHICESEAFDVLLSDVKMPGMNGHELVRWLVQRRPETRRILMTGFDDVVCERCGFAATPCRILRKPFVPREVLALVEGILEEARPVAHLGHN